MAGLDDLFEGENSVLGTLTINFDYLLGDNGVQKQAFQGVAKLGPHAVKTNRIWLTGTNTVCVKNLKEVPLKKAGRGKKQVIDDDLLMKMLVDEVASLECASALLEYCKSILKAEVTGKSIAFVRCALARDINNPSSIFMIEELIADKFLKFIHNARPYPMASLLDDPQALAVAEYLSFMQHLQFNVTRGLTFTSDFQGECELCFMHAFLLNCKCRLINSINRSADPNSSVHMPIPYMQMEYS